MAPATERHLRAVTQDGAAGGSVPRPGAQPGGLPDALPPGGGVVPLGSQFGVTGQPPGLPLPP